MNDPVTRSIDSLQRLYTIVVGLALTLALSGYLNPPPALNTSGATVPAETHIAVLLIMIVTLVPFYHGANRHLDATHVFVAENDAPPRYALMIDFCALFAEGIFMVMMGLSIVNEGRFLSLFSVLLLIDIGWAAFARFTVRTEPGRKATAKWFWINIVAVSVLYVVRVTPLLPPENRLTGALGVASLRTLVDYVLCWDFYVPAPRSSGGPGVA